MYNNLYICVKQTYILIKFNKTGGKKMNKSFRALKASLIMLLLLVSTLIIFTPPVPATAKLVSYPSIMSIEITEQSLEDLNNPISVDSTLTVQLKIGYAVSGPEWVFNWIEGENGIKASIANIWLFGSLVVFPQLLHLEIEEEPDWADISFLTSDVYIDDFSNNFVYTTADLIITPYYDAPNRPKTIKIKATAQPIGRIEGLEFHQQLNFQPDYIPDIFIEVENPTRQASPREAVNFKMNVKNLGNKETLVSGRIVDGPSNWAAIISPAQFTIPPGAEYSVTVSMTTPYDFGWHNELEKFSIEFTPQRSPPSASDPAGTPRQVDLRVNSVGFSTPGFEIIFVFAALVVTMALIKKRKNL